MVSWTSGAESMKGEKRLYSRKILKLTNTLILFREDERKWWGSTQISGQHNPRLQFTERRETGDDQVCSKTKGSVVNRLSL